MKKRKSCCILACHQTAVTMKATIGTPVTIKVDPAVQWQDTGLDIAPGEEYRFEARGRWIDFYIITDADGYTGRFLASEAKNKRAPAEKWLALMGATGQDDAKSFLIGKESQKTFDTAERLYCFANDIKSGGFYLKNNWGHLMLTITRLK